MLKFRWQIGLSLNMIPIDMIDFGAYWFRVLMTVIKHNFVIYWARKRQIGNTCYKHSVGNTANNQD